MEMKKIKNHKLIKSQVAKLQFSSKIIGGTGGNGDPQRSKKAGPMCVSDLTEDGVNC